MRSQLVFGGLASLALMGLLAWGVATGFGEVDFADPFKARELAASQANPLDTLGKNPRDLGVWMFSYQVLPFELTSLLLLAALLGAIMVARDMREEGRGRVKHFAPVAESDGSHRALEHRGVTIEDELTEVQA